MTHTNTIRIQLQHSVLKTVHDMKTGVYYTKDTPQIQKELSTMTILITMVLSIINESSNSLFTT